nr:NaeI family type II restriction endonuclease [Nocardiopsis mwathae]
MDAVESWFLSFPDLESRFAEVFRQAIDEVLDGQRTGRFDIHDRARVAKTELTYLGTKVEIVCQDMFELPRGKSMDYLVCEQEVDAKFSIGASTGQSIPREAVGRICLLMHARDDRGRFSVGLLRTTEDRLNPGKNSDGKRSIKSESRRHIRWLVRDGDLPENFLMRLSAAERHEIFDRLDARGNPPSGQERVNRLFRIVQGRVVDRQTVLTVAKQSDAPKRVRDARIALRDEGIMIFGHQNGHPNVCHDLGLPKCSKGEWISARLVPSEGDDGRRVTPMGSATYAVANDDEPPSPLPTL